MGKNKPKKRRKGRDRSGPTLAERADRHVLYQRAVQEPEADVDFTLEVFEKEFGRRPHVLREDFCGTALLCCEWAKAHPRNVAWGVDLDRETLDWGAEHNLGALDRKTRRRVAMVHGDVRSVATDPADVILAQNFSYFLFEERAGLVDYFRSCLANLGKEGMLVLDAYGGYDSMTSQLEQTEYDDFTYVWDQDDFDPIRHRATCYIHFEFPDGSRIERAFSYRWRMYTLPEIREALLEAGFSEARVYWEGTDPKTGEGDGVYTEADTADNDPAWVCYVAGFKR